MVSAQSRLHEVCSAALAYQRRGSCTVFGSATGRCEAMYGPLAVTCAASDRCWRAGHHGVCSNGADLANVYSCLQRIKTVAASL